MKMATSAPRGILALKKQHLADDDIEEDDIVLTASIEAAIRQGFNCSAPQNVSRSKSLDEATSGTSSDTISGSSTSTSSGSSTSTSSGSSDTSSDSRDAEITVDKHPELPAITEAVVVLERIDGVAGLSVPRDEPVRPESPEPSVPPSPAPGPSAAPSVDPVPGPSTAPDTTFVEVPRTSPLRNSAYEDISFQPLITSTPLRQEDVDEGDIARQLSQENLQLMCGIDENTIRKEIRDGKLLIKETEFNCLRDLTEFVHQNSNKYVSNLTKRRIKVSKTMASLIKKRRELTNKIDALLTALATEKEDLDTAIHKLNYFIDNFPGFPY